MERRIIEGLARRVEQVAAALRAIATDEDGEAKEQALLEMGDDLQHYGLVCRGEAELGQ